MFIKGMAEGESGDHVGAHIVDLATDHLIKACFRWFVDGSIIKNIVR